MSADARFGVVARDLVVDQERPVGRLKEQGLPLERREERERNPVAPVLEPFQLALGRVHLAPVRNRVLVPPHLKVASASPGAGRQAEDDGSRRGRERLGGRARHDALVPGKPGEDRLEEVHALEPPVAEQLEVEHRDDDRRVAVGQGRRAFEQLDEVVGVRREGAGDGGALVRELVAEVEARVRDAPVAVAARGALLVELEVAPVAGIADLAGPDLLRRERVSREDADALAVRGANRVDAVGRRAALRQVDLAPVGGDDAGRP